MSVSRCRLSLQTMANILQDYRLMQDTVHSTAPFVDTNTYDGLFHTTRNPQLLTKLLCGGGYPVKTHSVSCVSMINQPPYLLMNHVSYFHV